MEGMGTVAICQFGGVFQTNSDGTLSYTGGEAHAVDVECDMLFNEFKSEIASVFNVDVSSMTIKYFLPNNKEILITVSCDKDLKRMINYYSKFTTIYVYILATADNRAGGTVIADSGTSAVAAIRKNHNTGQCKRVSTNNITTKRVTRSSTRLTNAVASEVVTADTTEEPRGDACQSMDARNVFVNTSTPISANRLGAWSAGENDSVMSSDVETRHGTAAFDSAQTGAASAVPSGDPNSSYSPSLCDEIVIGLGQEFDNVKDFRNKLCQYAINKGFLYKFVKNTPIRVTVKCRVESCPWKLHASRSHQKKRFTVKKVNNVHTCGGDIGKEGKPRVTKSWLISILKDKLRDNPDYKPKDIAKDIYKEFGISLKYYQVWHGKAAAEQALLNMHVEASNQLPWFCERIRESNPGSAISLATSVDSKFRMFVAFHASLHGFEHGCRPLLILDRIHLKKNNQSKLLTAVAVDGDDAIFPVAFGAVEADACDSWLWFLKQLKLALATSRSITFVSARKCQLEEVIPRIFENCHHSYCLTDLTEDFRKELNKGLWTEEEKDAMVNSFECATEAFLVEDFNTHIESIREVSNEAADWIMAIKPEKWSNAFFKGARYNLFSAEVLEFDNWISVKQESSVILMIDAISSKLMEMMSTRQTASHKLDSILTPSMEEELKKEVYQTPKFAVLCSSDTVFEVRGDTVNVVNIGSWECTCREWQIDGLPCMHAIAVLDHLGKSVYDFCSQYFTSDCYRATYSESIHRIPDVERIVSVSSTELYPPRSRQLNWPRRKRDRRKKGEVRALRCSLCKGTGHNKATCEAITSTIR